MSQIISVKKHTKLKQWLKIVLFEYSSNKYEIDTKHNSCCVNICNMLCIMTWIESAFG